MSRLSMSTYKNIDNRPSQLQGAILEILERYPKKGREGGFIGDLAQTGDIVDALGRARDKAGYASVARSLKRLWDAGRIHAYSSEIYIRGKGYRWALPA